MRQELNRFLNEYTNVKDETFAGNPFGSFVRNEIPLSIYQTGLVDKDAYLVTGSVGQGNWAIIPWICVFDRNITTSATKGVYIVYLLSKDGNSLYLTFNQGCTDIRKTHTKKETIAIMRQKANDIRSKIDARGFATDDSATLGDKLTELGELYQEGIIFYRKYDKNSLPSEESLRQDLSTMMDIYKEYVNPTNNKEDKKTWLLAWNPLRWEWDDFGEAVKLTQSGGVYNDNWSCQNTQVKKGDSVFMIIIGTHDYNGIFAAGTALSESYLCDHWDPEKAAQGKKENKIDIGLNWIIDYKNKPYLTQQYLKTNFPKQHWSPQSSGIQIRQEYVSKLEEAWNKLKSSVNATPTIISKNIVDVIKNYIFSQGFTYTDNLIENFYLSLKSKPFVILAGTSGTGKTRLVRLFAEAINAHYKMVPVRPDWSDSSDLFGHVDLNGNYVPGEVIDFIAKAQNDPNRPYILCLDEMNLARVEYYLSDFLSVIETREVRDGKVVSDPLVTLEKYGTDTVAKEKYGEIRFPQNLYLVGTVNMDETTFPFSKKVLDRANTIEFDYVDLSSFQNSEIKSVEPVTAPNDFLKTKYLFLQQCMDDPEFVNDICTELQRINKILQKANAHVGYRVRDEIVFYMLNNKEAELLTQEEAMDNEIMQKILPRIQGSSISVKDMLCELFHEFAGDYEGYQTKSSDVASKMKAVLDKSADKVKYPKSAKKVAFMVRRFEEDGFTSYWL